MIFNFTGKFFTAALFFLFIASASIVKAQDVQAFEKYETITDGRQKVEAFKKFLVEFPSSQYKPYAYYEIFSAYLDLNAIDTALIFADSSAQSFPLGARVNIYNNIAYDLAKKKAGLDTALVYSQRVAEATSQLNLRVRGKFLDTQALVFYDLGKIDTAISLEKEAVAGNEEEPPYQSSLAVYLEADGQRTEALKTAANAILLGSTDEALLNFNKWLSEEKTDAKERQNLKDEIVNSVLKTFLEKSKGQDQNKIHSTAAAFLAYTEADLPQADKWAKGSLSSLNKNSSIDDKVLFTKNYALVLSAEGKNKEALKEFQSVEELADPWDGDFWYSLAQTYIKTGDNKKAFEAFINGSVAYPSDKITRELNKFAEKEKITSDEIQKLISKRQDELSSFNPGHFKGKTNGNVVLAELFTGAQCPPCAAADNAFDILSEFYPRDAVVILEYHEHIPAPDPMTNPDTFARYRYYGGNFGTPTVIFDGKDQITGGGPKFLAANRFNIYKYSIDKLFDKKPGVKISGTAEQTGNDVKVNLTLTKVKLADENLSLHVALVEKFVHYEGSNGITKHLFVVRNLIKGAAGIPFTIDKKSEKISESFNVDEIEKNISSYLDDPTKDASWRQGVPFKGWNQRTDKIDRNNLAVAAWIQNNDSKDVLQSFYVEVPKISSTLGSN